MSHDFAITEMKICMNITEMNICMNITEMRICMNITEMKICMNITEMKIRTNITEMKICTNMTEMKICTNAMYSLFKLHFHCTKRSLHMVLFDFNSFSLSFLLAQVGLKPGNSSLVHGNLPLSHI